ncbi:DNA invertase Pin-like site-specific DNA recombinase [Constrictibacter sp. MBR-5]|jgi:DNA invertase Pin-like site-specific DNA recombinase|uniref:recombinase family protein n=1 Tax=Constrictibacter sp. MBR-5 TaxID=3156467 RepID=UPI0033920F2B
MASGKFVSYIRVSTAQQGRSGLGLEAQQKAVRDYLNGGSWELVAEFVEVESGKRTDRPELDKAIKAARKAGATLIIAKLDRLARDVHFISGLMKAGVEFTAVDMPAANRLTIHILAAVAEHEREMISARTKAALQAVKARGVKLGNPTNLDVAQANSRAVRVARAEQHAANILPIVRQIQAAGATSLRAVAAALNSRGVRTPRGGEWCATQVKRVIDTATA